MAGITVNEELMFGLISDYAKKYNSIPETNKQAIQWAYEQGYAKAIDEFAEKLIDEGFSAYESLEDYFEDTIECVAIKDIREIAEQMKAGAE